MGVFDFETNCAGGNNRIKDECIIAFKVYDSCRQQDCLDRAQVGLARAAKSGTFCGTSYDAGELIVPPPLATGVFMKDVRVKKVNVLSKTESQFKRGYWDIELAYIIEYKLVFKGAGGTEICRIPAQNTFIKSVSLFGSEATNTTISTDLSVFGTNSFDMDADPFVYVESKAVGLKAQLFYSRCCPEEQPDTADGVRVHIGLFTIIKLYRIVNLSVKSNGFCIPEECEDTGSTEPCEFFNGLDFPLDFFAPPQKPEFMAGISNNIPNTANDNDDNNHNHHCPCCKKS